MCCSYILYTMKNEPLKKELNDAQKTVCPVEKIIEVIGGKWKLVILFHLMGGTKRFNELRRLMPDVTQRMLTRQLRELEEHGILERKIYAQVPPKVEYSLTKRGKSLNTVLDVLHNWGAENFSLVDEHKP